MKNRIPKLAALAIVAGSLLAPSLASADPDVTIVVDGTPFADSGTGHLGQALTLEGRACIDPATNEPGYLGLFLSTGGDPNETASTHVFESLTDAAGGFVMTSSIDLETVGWHYARFYCSTQPVSTLTDPSMLWVSPVTTMMVDSAPAATAARTVQAARQTKRLSSTSRTTATIRTTKTSRTATTGGPTLRIETDPDGLPLIDRIGIVGPKAAALKAKTDAIIDRQVRIERLLTFLTRGRSTARPVSNARYVAAAFEATTGRTPSARVMAPFIDRLDEGALKVAVVEDIALTVHPASWWNAR